MDATPETTTNQPPQIDTVTPTPPPKIDTDTTTSPVSQDPKSPQFPKSNKLILIIVISFVVIAVISALAYSLGVSRTTNQAVDNQEEREEREERASDPTNTPPPKEEVPEPSNPPEISTTSIYSNLTYGFALNIPNHWDGYYEVEEPEGAVKFAYTKDLNSDNEKDYLFFINFYSEEAWDTLSNSQTLVQLPQELARKNGLVFTFSYDIGGDLTDEGDDVVKFQKMTGDIADIIDTFRFTEEIPDNIVPSKPTSE